MRVGLCGQGLVPGGFPVPGEQLAHTGVRQLRRCGEDIGEPGLRSTFLWAIACEVMAGPCDARCELNDEPEFSTCKRRCKSRPR